MRTKPKLPMANGIGAPETEFSNSDWERIERAYGHSLPPDVRSRVCEETQKFIRYAEVESNAEPLEHAELRLSKVQAAADRFMSALVEQLKGPDAAFYVKRLISTNLDGRVPEGTDKIDFIQRVMIDFQVACHRAKKEMSNRETMGFREGLSWEEWIRRLAKIVREAGLPTGARKDSDKQKTDAPSPFVSFVWELQECVPPKHRRSTQSHVALAQGIHRARDPKTSEGRSQTSRRTRTK